MTYSLAHVLIVDDMASIRMLIRAHLNAMGIQRIGEAGNGQDALKYLGRNPVDLVVCDWNMPGMTGLEVLIKIRQHPRLNALPVLLVTAEQSPTQVKDAIQAGVTSYVVKPFLPAILKAHIRKCLAGWIPR